MERCRSTSERHVVLCELRFDDLLCLLDRDVVLLDFHGEWSHLASDGECDLRVHVVYYTRKSHKENRVPTVL